MDIDQKIRELVVQGLTTDGRLHKQWCLEILRWPLVCQRCPIMKRGLPHE